MKARPPARRPSARGPDTRREPPRALPSRVLLDWQDLELGMFFHFDIPVYRPGWDWRTFENLPPADAYQPAKLDTDQWIAAARAMGARYAVFVAKHCSGFLQWQSDLYPYGVRQTSWRGGEGDVVADFVASCRKAGIRPGLYASTSANAYLRCDANHVAGGDAAVQARYARVCERMAEELWSRYGDFAEIWFDGGALPVEEGGPDLVPILLRHQPGAVVFQGPAGAPNLIRWVGNERGVAPQPCWSTAFGTTRDDGTQERKYEGHPDAPFWIPGECDVPVRRDEWFWRLGEEGKVRTLDELMEIYETSIGRNCNLLLNANIDPGGLVPEPDFSRYAEFGREVVRRYGRSLAETHGPGWTLELAIEPAREVGAVAIMEDLAQGERVRAFAVETLAADGAWRLLCDGESVGHKRIVRFPGVATARLRLRVAKSEGEPRIRRFAAFKP